ncbi:MAG: NADH-quinone oxidoreductase subunit J [Verrucomicrobiota bacterium]
MEALVFWILAFGLVGSGLAVILNRNPVASALSLVITFVFLAAIFVSLEAFFLAMVQIIVYAGAVMVLFLFIIMLLDIKAEERRPFPWVKLSLTGLLGVAFFFIFDRVLKNLPQSSSILTWGESPEKLTAKKLGEVLFSNYLLPFEVTALLLLVATIGVVMLSRREGDRSKRSEESSS